MTAIPLLIMADSIAGSSGLARIARDLAIRIYSDLSDTFRVGSFGIGGPIASSSKFPFFNCSVMRLQGTVPMELPAIWKDFAGDEKGIVLLIQNASWVQFMAQPHLLQPLHPLREFLLPRPQSVSREHWESISNPGSPSFSPALLARLSNSPFQRWLYCPIDGHLPDGTLGHQLAPILAGFDRLLAYNRYGAEVIEKTLEKWGGQSVVSVVNSVPNLPHGFDRTVWFPRDRAQARQTFFSRISNGQSALPLKDDQVLVCMCGTNSSRKTWGDAFQATAELLRRGANVFLWGHTDALQPSSTNPAVHWNLLAMVRQFGLDGRVCLTTDRLADDTLAWAYSACDVMIATSSEGFGYSPFEALACGLPVVGTTYAGSAEFTPPAMRISPVAFSSESPYLIQRPIYDVGVVVDKVEEILSHKFSHARSLLDPRYEWENCWPEWKSWLLGHLK
jgi:glycosyltransferase involved in cell wall biosynthesis